MTNLKRILASCVPVALSVLVWTGAGQQRALAVPGSPDLIVVDSGRPLAEVVLKLEQRHGVVITYEDPPYQHESQLVDVTNANRGRKPVGGRRLYVPRGGPFSFEYVLQPGRPELQMQPVLSALLRQFRSTGYPGDFRLDKTADMFHIVPVLRRAQGGQDVPYDAILSTELSFVASDVEQTALEALQELVNDLGRATGISVGVGTVPTNLLNTTKVRGRTGNASARWQLVRILASTGRRLSWRLLYDPDDAGMFVLNVHPVAR